MTSSNFVSRLMILLPLAVSSLYLTYFWAVAYFWGPNPAIAMLLVAYFGTSWALVLSTRKAVIVLLALISAVALLLCIGAVLSYEEYPLHMLLASAGQALLLPFAASLARRLAMRR